MRNRPLQFSPYAELRPKWRLFFHVWPWGISQEKVTSWIQLVTWPRITGWSGCDVRSHLVWPHSSHRDACQCLLAISRSVFSGCFDGQPKGRRRRDPDDRNGDEGSNIAGRKTGVQSTRSKSRSFGFDQPKRRLSPRSTKSSVLQKQPKLGISPIQTQRMWVLSDNNWA